MTSDHQSDNKPHDAKDRIRVAIESVHARGCAFPPCPVKPPLFPVLFIALTFFRLPQFTNHGPFFYSERSSEASKWFLSFPRACSRFQPFVVGRDNMKKCMPSMPIQARVV